MAFICGLWCATEDILEDACSQLRQRFDSIEMKQVTKILQLSQYVSFDFFILFSSWFWQN